MNARNFSFDGELHSICLLKMKATFARCLLLKKMNEPPLQRAKKRCRFTTGRLKDKAVSE